MPDGAAGEADGDRCTEGFAALCPAAAGKGVTVCYGGRSRQTAFAFAERVSPAFGCYVDLANPGVSGPDPATEARRLDAWRRRRRRTRRAVAATWSGARQAAASPRQFGRTIGESFLKPQIAQ